MASSSSGSSNSSTLNFHHTLDDAIKSNLVPYQEYFLQGSIYDEDVKKLLERLKGLCSNCLEKVETFQDHEISYAISRPPEKPLRLRVRRALDQDDKLIPYIVRYVGITEAGDYSQVSAVRTSIDVTTTSNIVVFLEQLGYKKEYEFVARGYVFQKGRMKITVSKINKAKESRHLNVLGPVTDSHLVEMSVVEPAGHQTRIDYEMKQFADSLKPLVYMDKADQFRPV